MAARASEGQARAVELRWREQVKEQYAIHVAPFVARDRQNLKYLLSGFTIPEALRLLEGAIQYWPILRREPYLAKLPPTPVFRDLFWMRDHVQSFLIDMERRQEQQQKMNANYAVMPARPPCEETTTEMEVVPEEPPAPAPPRLSLTEMVLVAKKKLREERKEAANG